MAYTGKVVYIYAFDVAYDMAGEPPARLLGAPVVRFAAGMSRRRPEKPLFFLPHMIRLTPEERVGPGGTVEIERTVKLLPLGAISVSISVPFSVETLEDLIHYHDLSFGPNRLAAEAHEIAENVRRELQPLCSRPVERIEEDEGYPVFCLNASPDNGDAAASWIRENRREVASLIKREADPGRLSDQEVDAVCGHPLSYYNRDAAIADWDAALLIDDPQGFDESLHVIELANLQLVELEAYDGLLDASLDRAYRDVSEGRLTRRRRIVHELREMRIDATRVSDELSNITKFFGEWHLARLYQRIADRFHLSDWDRSVEKKLETLSALYEMLKHDRENRWMLILEALIVLLFVADLALIFMLR